MTTEEALSVAGDPPREIEGGVEVMTDTSSGMPLWSLLGEGLGTPP